MRVGWWAVVGVAGCSQTPGLCELDVDDVGICLEDVGGRYCRQDFDGRFTAAPSSCASLGYRLYCTGALVQTGEITGEIEGTAEQYGAWVTDEAACTALTPQG